MKRIEIALTQTKEELQLHLVKRNLRSLLLLLSLQEPLNTPIKPNPRSKNYR
jgi:hypothetical protein